MFGVLASCAYLFCVSVACSYVFCALSSANRESFARFSASVGSNVEMGGVTPHWFSAAMMASRCSWRMRCLGDREVGCRARLLMSRPAFAGHGSSTLGLLKVRRLSAYVLQVV